MPKQLGKDIYFFNSIRENIHKIGKNNAGGKTGQIKSLM